MPKSARQRRIDAERELMQEKERQRQLCGAEKANGKPCKREAGWGTTHEGSGRCKHHGGASPNGEVAAAKEQALGMAKPIDVTPGQALAGVLSLAAGQLAYVTWKVSELAEDEVLTQTGINPWVRLQRNMMIDVAKMAKLAADAGIDERMADLAEQQTAMVASLVEAVLGELELSKEQKLKAGPAMRKHLALVQGQATEVSSEAV